MLFRTPWKERESGGSNGRGSDDPLWSPRGQQLHRRVNLWATKGLTILTFMSRIRWDLLSRDWSHLCWQGLLWKASSRRGWRRTCGVLCCGGSGIGLRILPRARRIQLKVREVVAYEFTADHEDGFSGRFWVGKWSWERCIYGVWSVLTCLVRGDQNNWDFSLKVRSSAPGSSLLWGTGCFVLRRGVCFSITFRVSSPF